MISTLLNKRAGVSLEDPNVPLGKFTLLEVMGGGSRTWAGKSVNSETAKTISGVWSAVTTISGSVASLPIRVVQYRADGKTRDQVREHRLHHLLNVEASPGISAVSYREAVQAQLLLRGNSVSDAPRDRRGELEALYLLAPDAYEIHKRRVGEVGVEPIVILRPAEGVKVRALQPGQMLKLCGIGGDGVKGWSVIRYGRETFGAAIGQEEYGARFFSNDATPRGVLEHPGALSPGAKDSLRSHWNGLYGGSSNAHRVAVLEEGMAFKPVSISAEDSQFIETKKHTLRDVARWFNIQPHKVGDLADAKWANIDAQNLEYLQDCLMPWLVRHVQAYRGQLLTQRERDAGLSVEFDFRELLRGDVEARSAYFQARFNTGSITPNEIRMEEGENPMAGGDDAYLQQQYIPVAMIQDVVQATLMAASSAPAPAPAPAPADGDELNELAARRSLQLEAGDRVRAREDRAFQARLDLREGFFSDFLDRAARQVKGELREVRKLTKRHLEAEVVDAPGFSEAIGEYYRGGFVGFARGVYAPGFKAYAAAVAPQAVEEAPEEADGEAPTQEELDAFADGYTVAAVDSIAAGGRRRLQELAAGDEPLEAVQAELEVWEGNGESSGRAERIAKRHVNELNQATSALVWGALAVAWLVARTVSESCPYCNAIDGTRVAPGVPFFSAGDSIQPEGADVPLAFKRRIGHPPFHPGCDCVIRPEA